MGLGVDVGINLKFYIKVFHVMGKALSGKLSCMGTDLVLLGGNYCDCLSASLNNESL